MKKIEIGLLPYAQAMLMARYIRQDIDNYPVFSNKNDLRVCIFL